MVELTRTVRFCVSATPANGPGGPNTFAASPAMSGLGAFYELLLTCRGSPDAQTGYLMNIKELDAIARRKLLPFIQNAFVSRPAAEPATLLPEMLQQFQIALPETAWSIQWRLTPYHHLTMESDDMAYVQLSQQFEFAAAHRLNVPELSVEENRQVFGKCNNPNGHGHNYHLKVAVSLAVPVDGSGFNLHTLETIVKSTVIDRFDHKNLNSDCPEFASLNPSVEHIASICYELLDEPLKAAGTQLHHVTVWETPKTSCTVACKG